MIFADGERAPSRVDVAELIRSGEVLEYKSRQRPAIVRDTSAAGESRIIKFWYPKGLFSSDRLRPYSERFRRNTESLAARGVRAPEVLGWGAIADDEVSYVCYPEIPGTALREVKSALNLAAFTRFLLQLHESGIYFRALHLGNVLKCDAGGFALIDISDCRFKPAPLSLRLRAKNLSGLCAHPDDEAYFQDGGWVDLVMAYARQADLALDDAADLRDRVDRYNHRWKRRRAGR